MWGAQALLEVRRRFLVGSGRPSMLMLVRSAAALATMRPILLLRVLKKELKGRGEPYGSPSSSTLTRRSYATSRDILQAADAHGSPCHPYTCATSESVDCQYNTAHQPWGAADAGLRPPHAPSVAFVTDQAAW